MQEPEFKDLTELPGESVLSGTKCMESRVFDLESTTSKEFRIIDVRLSTIEAVQLATFPHLATKADLLKLENEVNKRFASQQTEMAEMRVEITDLRTEMGELRTEMGELRTEVGELRTEMGELRTEVGELRTDLRAEMRVGMAEMRTEMRAEMNKMRSTLMKWFVATSFATMAIVVAIVGSSVFRAGLT